MAGAEMTNSWRRRAQNAGQELTVVQSITTFGRCNLRWDERVPNDKTAEWVVGGWVNVYEAFIFPLV